ncbi:MAG: protein-L-isoaspartate(D-aspartate) O-methyltransferase [Flavobacteriaceae bacterium]
MEDNPKHQGQRRQLVDALIEKGIESPQVLEALREVPRHWFMDPSLAQWAYVDKAYPIAAEQTISQPYTVAFQSELLDLAPGAKVLEIGTGSGYQSAILLAMGMQLYTIERQQELYKNTKRLFTKLGLRPKKMIFGDGYKGLPEAAPFDGVLVTAAAPELPKALLGQLAIGGKLVIPIGTKEQFMFRYTRRSETQFDREKLGEFRFVPMVQNKN